VAHRAAHQLETAAAKDATFRRQCSAQQLGVVGGVVRYARECVESGDPPLHISAQLFHGFVDCLLPAADVRLPQLVVVPDRVDGINGDGSVIGYADDSYGAAEVGWVDAGNNLGLGVLRRLSHGVRAAFASGLR
jgi:hypothetical protein